MVSRDRTIENLIERLNRLPGIGPKSAERLAFHLLRIEKAEALQLAAAIEAVRAAVKTCSRCFNLDAQDPCSVCSDDTSERGMLLVVEDPRELSRFEDVGYRGLYHVLQGRMSQLENIGPDDLRIAELIERIRTGHFAEVILALDADVEGEATGNYLVEVLAEFEGLKISRLAHGISVGGGLENADELTLFRALEGRVGLG